MEETEDKDPSLIEFHYIKSKSFKTCFATGVYGGIGPQGFINMNFFIERNPIPKIVYSKIEGKKIVDIPERTKGKSGVVREVEANIVLDIVNAKALKEWLTDHIEDLENQIKNSK